MIRVICVVDSSSNISSSGSGRAVLGVLYFYARVSVPEAVHRKLAAIFPAWLGVARPQGLAENYTLLCSCKTIHSLSHSKRDQWREAPELRKMWVFVGVSERGAPPRRIQIRSCCMWLPYIYLCVHTPRLPPILAPYPFP